VTPSDRAFALRTVRRAPLFLVLCGLGILAGAGLGTYALWRAAADPTYRAAPLLVTAVLVLLNARGNLRQYRYARVLKEILPPASDD
jgi:hypothetical protein